jgi:glucose/arabinose dehydrogenase
MTRKTFLASLAAVPAVPADTQKRVTLPPPYHTPSSNNRPQVIDKPAGAQLKVPAGFAVEEIAGGFERPRFMLLDGSGAILLTDSVVNGSVYRLTNNGKQKTKIIENLDRPFGMAFWKDYLYVAETTSLKRYKYDAKTGKAGAGEEIFPMPEYAKGHWTRAVTFDRRGNKMYLSIGSASNVDAGEPKDRAAILRFNPDGSGKEYFAEGTRNPVSLHFYPGTDTLWASVQERDLIGDDLVPDYLTSIKQGGFYGWPYAYIGPNEDPRRKGEKPDWVAKTIVPDIVLGAHVAVLDFRFYTGKSFPKEYHGGAFLALHGSWNRAKRVGYSVTFVPFKNGKPSGEPKDFLAGWLLHEDKREVWGRPVGILQLADGSLLVSDDGGNKLWRVFYKG